MALMGLSEGLKWVHEGFVLRKCRNPIKKHGPVTPNIVALMGLSEGLKWVHEGFVFRKCRNPIKKHGPVTPNIVGFI